MIKNEVRGRIEIKREVVFGRFGQGLNTLPSYKVMKPKERIDSFIGLLPDLLKEVYNNVKFERYRNIAQNNAYWKGYVDAKKELRNKLYEKEGIEIPKEEDLYMPNENMDLYGNLIEKL